MLLNTCTYIKKKCPLGLPLVNVHLQMQFRMLSDNPITAIEPRAFRIPVSKSLTL